MASLAKVQIFGRSVQREELQRDVTDR